MCASMNVHVCDAVIMTHVPKESHHRTRQDINEDYVSYYFCLFLIKVFTGDYTCMYFDSQQSSCFANVITLRNINKAWIGTYTIILKQTVSQYKTTNNMMVGHVSWLRKSNSVT